MDCTLNFGNSIIPLLLTSMQEWIKNGEDIVATMAQECRIMYGTPNELLDV